MSDREQIETAARLIGQALHEASATEGAARCTLAALHAIADAAPRMDQATEKLAAEIWKQARAAHRMGP